MLSATYSPEQYDITSGVTEFAITWGFFALTDIKVTITTFGGGDTVLEYGTGAGKFTVSAINDDFSSGATLTTGTAYPSSYKITIERVVPYGQALDINGDFIPGEPLEQALDKLSAQIQQIKDSIARTITIPSTDPATLDMVLGNSLLRSNTMLGFDASGEPILMSPSQVSNFLGF
jgi:hypothetical protein